MDLTTQPVNFKQMMQQHQQLANQLIEALALEKQALKKNDMQQVEAALKQKFELLAAIESKTQETDNLFKQANIETGNTAFENYIQQCPTTEQAALKQQWQQLKNSLQKCQEDNVLNGMIISAAQRQNQAILSLYLGSDMDNDVYDPTGKTRTLNTPQQRNQT